MKSIRHLFAMLCVSALLGGCAGLAPSPEQSAAELRTRAEAFWKARKVNDLVSAYTFEEVSIGGKTSVVNYIKGKGAIDYQALEIRGVELKDADTAVVRVWMRYAVPSAALKTPIEGEAEDEWKRIDGVWYHAYLPPGLVRAGERMKQRKQELKQREAEPAAAEPAEAGAKEPAPR